MNPTGGQERFSPEFNGTDFSCHRYIVKTRATAGATTTLPYIMNPFDYGVGEGQLEIVVKDNAYQIWDAKPIKTYQAIYGQAAPNLKPPLVAGACYLQVVDARASELYSPPPHGQHPNITQSQKCFDQGCAVQNDSEDPGFIAEYSEFFSVRIPTFWDGSYFGDNQTLFENTMNSIGHKSMSHYQRVRIQADGSVKMQVPCDTPLNMANENAQGEVIAVDDISHSLRPGETRTCHGCHDVHSEERDAELGGVSAEDRFASTMAAQLLPPLGRVRTVPVFSQVWPIVERTCGGCHAPMVDTTTCSLTNDVDNSRCMWARLAYDWKQEKYGDEFKKYINTSKNQLTDAKYTLWGNYRSQLVSKFALESPLYWYAKGQRTDGFSNNRSQEHPVYKDWDIDFNTNHPPSGVTPDELTLLRDWLDNGAPYQ
jgi:hypothetical protein